MADVSTIRYGVVGTGMMGVEHIENIAALEGAEVTAICDPEPSSIERAVAAIGHGAPTFHDHRDLIASGLCDAVVIASPNHTHVDVLPDALASELHVMIEKPLCTTTEDCEAMLRLADDRPDGLITWMAMEYRYMPAVAELLTLVERGVVGTPRMIAIREHRFPFLDKVGKWNRLSRNTGGTLVEKTCHFFDLMNLVLDERPVRVMASGAQDVNHLDEMLGDEPSDVLDNAFVIVDYPSGRRALLDLCMFADATGEQEEMSVVGELGKIEAKMPSNTVHVGRRGEHWIGDVETYTAHDPEIAHEGLHHGSSYLEHVRFADAVRGGTPPEVTLVDGYWAVAMGVAAHRSIEVGRPIELSEVMQPAAAERR